MRLERIKDRRGVLREIERREGAPCVVRTGWTDDRSHSFTLVVTFGLNMLRGNRVPYFTLTGDEVERWDSYKSEHGGTLHDTIVRELPELADLAALHLSWIDGTPMHAEENGWYWLAGACGGLGQQYHGGTGRVSEREPLVVFAEHCRITATEAEGIKQSILAVSGAKEQRALWKWTCDTMRPRWQREAEAAVKKYGLTVFGDYWEMGSKKEVKP